MKLKNIFKSYLIIILLIAPCFKTTAQINTNTNVTALQLAQAMVGPGATVLNPLITGPLGSYAIFSNGSSTNIGIDHGIILTCGDANIPSSNTSSPWSTPYNTPGDPLLSFAGTTNDACRFEFDVVAYDSILTFNYVFGSDEYNDWVGSSFNDAFGFFISGPGIVGQPNIALIPGTSTQVSINNVNCGANGNYYVCNDWFNPTGGSCTNQCPTSQAQTSVEYDGFTVLLTAQAAVSVCDTYHLVLVIADVSDAAYDSGVLISNLLAGTVVYQNVSTPIPNYPTNSIVEGCTTGEIQVKKISNNGPCGVIDTSGTCQLDTVCYHIVTGGNAIEGIDYISLPDTVCISALDSIFYLNIIPISDGIFEPPFDTIIVDLYPILDSLDTANCSSAASLIALHAMFLLMDPILQSSPDDTICETQSITLSAITNLPNMVWTPAGTLSCSSCALPVASPANTTQYTVQASLGTCTLSDNVIITVSSVPIVNAGDDVSICPGKSVGLNATNATTYVWLNPSAATLSNQNIPNPIATPTVQTTYIVQGSDNLCGTTTDTVIVSIYPDPVIIAGPDTSICPDNFVQLFVYGGVSYTWSGTGLMNDNIQFPLALPQSSTENYIVTATDVNGCIDTAQVTIHVYDEPMANAGIDIEIFLFDSTQLNASGGGFYSWSPTTGLNNPTIANPVASPTVTTMYILTMTTADGCVDLDTVFVLVNNDPIVKVPNAFSPNGDGHNDYLKIIRLGVFDLTYIKIFNRWGEIVFETHSLSGWWDGNYKGQPCEVGVYTYILVGEGYGNNHIEQKGNITLVR